MSHGHTQDFIRMAQGLVADEPVMSFYDVPDGASTGED
jgi:hypothetical protein